MSMSTSTPNATNAPYIGNFPALFLSLVLENSNTTNANAMKINERKAELESIAFLSAGKVSRKNDG